MTATTATKPVESGPPPYTSYATFKTLLNQLREQFQLPRKIDRHVMRKFSGSQQKALLPALRFLGLIDADDVPQKPLHDFHKAKGAEEKLLLKALLEKYYPDLVKELATGTAATLRNAFDFPNTSDSTKKACMAFFIAAAKDAGYEISPYVLAKSWIRREKRVGNVVLKAKSATEKKDESPNAPEPPPPAGLVAIPIPVGIGKTWQVWVAKDYTEAEIEHFTDIIGKTLKLGVKKAK